MPTLGESPYEMKKERIISLAVPGFAKPAAKTAAAEARKHARKQPPKKTEKT